MANFKWKTRNIALKSVFILAILFSILPGAAHAQSDPIEERYLTAGGRDVMGEPDSTQNNLTCDWEGVYRRFGSNSAIYYHPRTSAQILQGYILARYLEIGQGYGGGECSWLGYPITDEYYAADNYGRYNRFENGVIYWSEETGAHEMRQDIYDKWFSLGNVSSFLGYPVTGSVKIDDQNYYNQFEHGLIWWNTTYGAFEMHGEIWNKFGGFSVLGWYDISRTGAPMTNVLTSDNVGEYVDFERLSIYHHPDLGTYSVQGAIRNKWADLGWETSFLGYPLTDELWAPDQNGRYNHFQGGSIYWHPNIGAYEVHGFIRDFWANQAWEQGPLGYPMSDEQDMPGGRYSVFEGGVVAWKPGIDPYYANYRKISADMIIQMIDNQIPTLIANTPLYVDGPTEIVGVHHWYPINGTRYYRVLEIVLNLKADVEGVIDPEVTLHLFLTIELQEGQIVVRVVDLQGSADSPWWADLISLGFQEIVDSVATDQMQEQMQSALGRSFNLPALNTLAAQIQDDGSVNLYHPD